MVVAGLFALMLSRLWTNGAAVPGSMGVGFAVVVLAMLWFASGGLAHRLVRPMNAVVAVVQRLGEGDLAARARFPAAARDEVARVAHAIDDMADRVERQVREERQLLAVVSHELRTPLARIRVLTDLAREGHRTAVDDIDREVAEVDDLVSKVLARSRLAFGAMTPRRLRLPEAVAEALERLGVPASLMDVRDARANGDVSADPTLVHRALANLIDNAQKHGGGVTGVTVRSSNTGVEVEVRDAGPGFSAGASGARFDAFGPDAAGGRGSGLGLGLHLVHAIAAAHHGRVWAENRPEGGARVGFALPFAPEALPPEGPSAALA
jgi:signal transduction histidine kinase